jgi:histidyl-tRNA synthetase
MEAKAFEESCMTILDSEEKTARLRVLLNSKNFEEFCGHIKETSQEFTGFEEVRQVLEGLSLLGINNVRFDQSLMIGFDYYTGIVFEVFDNNPSNRRSIFGGGRYDELGKIFGDESVPAVGFGAGDVIARDLMETYRTIPSHKRENTLSILSISNEVIPYCLELAQRLRQANIEVAVDFSEKKIGDKISACSKRGLRRCITVGEDEIKSGLLPIKDLASNKEEKVSEDQITNHILNQL